LIPHKRQSPIKHSLLCHSWPLGLEHTMKVHSSISLENEIWLAQHFPTF
jgi:hypothetical protein